MARSEVSATPSAFHFDSDVSHYLVAVITNWSKDDMLKSSPFVQFSIHLIFYTAWSSIPSSPKTEPNFTQLSSRDTKKHQHTRYNNIEMFDSSFSYSSEQPLSRNASDSVAIKLMHDIDVIMHLNPDCKGIKLVSDPSANPQEYKIEDSLAFVPKKLWSGGVWYTAFFKPVDDGCDITIQAPGGFTSTNKWRLVKKADGQRFISITSDAKCSKTFAYFVKKFLESQHGQLQRSFNERVEATARPGTLRRRSSVPRSFRAVSRGQDMVAA